MYTCQKSLTATLFALAHLVLTGRAQTLDTVVFGNTTSENSHSLTTYFPPATNTATVGWVNTPNPSDPSATGPSDVVSGGLGISARRLLPRTPNGDVYGGQMTVTMTVDPVKQNYFSVKLWGSDPNGSNYLILDCDGKEVGVRHGGGGGLSEDTFWYGAGQWYPNRFFYRTAPLPMSMTRGRTSVTLTIRSVGSIFTYAPIFTYVPQYQSLMAAPSEQIYAAYTHAGALLDVSTEAQGVAPAVQTPRTVENETTQLDNVMSSVNAQLASDLQNAPANLSQGDAAFLAGCYDALTNAGANYITYPTGQSNATLGAQVLAILDNAVTSYAAGSGIEGSDWGGGLGPMGDAVRLTWPLISGSMSASVNYGGTLGTTTRQAGWAKALRASVDAGRYNRQTIGNQAIDNGTNIYRANRGCLLVNAASALNESEASRYPKEACGILPWLGNDQATGGTDGVGGGPTPTRGTAPYGPNWYMCTTKGLTKDGEGFVGGDYGELGPFVYRFGLISGDSQLQARGIAMTRARFPFRYPGADANGFLITLSPDPIGDRNNQLPGHVDYVGQSNPDDFLMVSQGASVVGNDIVGAMQEEITHGQIYQYFSPSDPYLPPRWATIKAMAQTNVPLPTTPGQPDFAWADEENMAVAAKHGEERFYANLFWRQPPFINGLAKVFDLTPTLARLGDVAVDDVRFRATGQTVTTGSAVDGFATPEDNPQEAFGGLPYSVAYRSDLSAVPANNRDAGRGTGYTLRYGNWLVGINADYSATYPVKLPTNFTSATDLISGQVLSGPVTLQPKTSVVFYLPTTTDPLPLPARSLYANAIGTNGQVTVTWANASAATSYNVLRSTTSGSGYATVATGLTGTSYADTTITKGTTYYYVVTSVGANGVSGYSPEASAAPVAPETLTLAAPWTDVDEGVSTGGSATLLSGTFTVKAGGGTFGGTTEGFHLVYQPMSGDGVLTAKISSQSGGSTTASRAGLVLRDNLAQNATMAAMLLQKTSSTKYTANFQYCGGDGGSIVTAGGPGNLAEPYWVRLVRSGLTITGYVSSNGTTWTLVGAYTYSALPYTCYAGLLVNYGTTTSSTTTATFTNVTFPLGATAAPSAPTGLTTTSATATSAALSWTAAAGAVSYNVKRGTSASGPFTTVASGVVTTTYTDYGLVNGNTYYYVVSAVDGFGESANSSAAAAAVLSPPATLSGLQVTVSGTQAVLSWTASPGATSYIVSRSTSYAGTYTVIASGVTGTSYTDTGLAATTLYYYKVTPVGGGGSGMGGEISALPTGLPVPWLTQDIGSNVPGGAYAASGVFNIFGNGYGYTNGAESYRSVYQSLPGDGAITVRLTSQSSANNDTAGVMVRDSFDPAGPYVYLSLLSNSSSNQICWQYRATTGAAVQRSFGGISSGLTCWLRMVRFGNTYVVYYSADGQAWTQFGAFNIILKPTVCVGMAVASGDGAAINTATFDNVAVTASVVGGGTATASSQNNANGQGAAQAFDAQIGTKWLTSVNTATGFLQYQFAAGVSQVVNQYQIISAEDVPQRDPASWQFQGSSDGATWTTLDTQTGQVFANRNQANVYNIPNTTAYPYYRLNITANNGGSGYGIQLSELNLYAANPGTALVPPATPLDLSATWSSGQIALNWQATFMAASYNVKRGTATGGPYTTVASGLTSPNYTDTTVTNGTPYYYVVSAVNVGGESANSVENSATAYAVPATPTGVTASPGNAQAIVSWAAVPGVSGYNVKRATVSGGPYSTVAGAMTTSYTDTAVTIGTVYYYVVSAVDLGGESANSTEVHATPALLAPTGLSATAGNGQAALTWNAQPNATSYNVKRATVSGGPYTVVGNPSVNSFTNTGLSNGTAYYYVVSTLVSGQQSANSNEVTVTPYVTYNAWQALYFTPAQMNVASTSSPDGDANGDGYKNIVAYAFNVDPWDNITGALPSVQIANGHLTISFIRRTDPTDVTYTVEVSGDLIGWASGSDYTTNLSVTPLDANTERVVVSDNAPASSGARFMHVRIDY